MGGVASSMRSPGHSHSRASAASSAYRLRNHCRNCATVTGELSAGIPDASSRPSSVHSETRPPVAVTAAAATARAITDDGYVRTGDCGYTRDDGSFVHEARIGDVLKLSGFMVSPAEIEAVLLGCAGVAQCQVVGVPSERGQRAVAFVRVEGEFDEAQLQRACGEQLARYKMPARIVRLDAFPTTAGANAPKIQKNKLREMAQALSL